ncbi:hypothetical protein HYD96_03930 [Mycoplasmopsis bovis]|nr:hypothetical protein [Mycoplasmopsis bovis]QQH34777.1 hypothetical protein HYD96_03930 [Mycoplasmopsis bovis]
MKIPLKWDWNTNQQKSKWWNRTPEKLKNRNLTKNYLEKKTEGELTEDEEKLIDKNLYNGLTQDENHIWGEDDDSRYTS